MKRSELLQHPPGIYWFKVGKGDDAEWIVARLLQSRLIEYPNGDLVPHLPITHLTGPIPKSSFEKTKMSSRPLLAQRKAKSFRRVSGGQP